MSDSRITTARSEARALVDLAEQVVGHLDELLAEDPGFGTFVQGRLKWANRDLRLLIPDLRHVLRQVGDADAFENRPIGGDAA